jgi:hypothetical protein
VTRIATPIPPTIAKRGSPPVGNSCESFIESITQDVSLQTSYSICATNEERGATPLCDLRSYHVP